MGVFKTKNFDWHSGLFLIVHNLLLFITLPIYLFFRMPSMGLLLSTGILMIMISLGVTAGYHRLYSHRAYKINKFAEVVLLFFGTLASENSVLRWSADHRMHHRFVDTDKDPYNIKRGFWYAHILWIFTKPHPLDTKIVADLMKNKLVVLQAKYFTSLCVLANFLVFFLFGFIFNDFFGDGSLL